MRRPNPPDRPAPRPLRRGTHQAAAYREETDPLYEGNPLIEALPELRTRKEVTALTSRLPRRVTEEERRDLPHHVREHRLGHLSAFKVSLSQDLRLHTILESLIREGYVARNPMALGAGRAVASAVDALAAENAAATGGACSDPAAAWAAARDAAGAVLDQSLHSSARQLTLLGISGGGKSLGLQAALAGCPQTIAHTAYAGRPFLTTQVPWLILDCPYDGSTRALCVQFFHALDEVLRSVPRAAGRPDPNAGGDGTAPDDGHGEGAERGTLVERYVDDRARVDDLLSRMGRVARLVHLGVLVIDEVQVLSEAKSGGAQHMLNFLLQLVNTIGVPVVLVGTYKAYRILGGQLRLARRGATAGDLMWQALPLTEPVPGGKRGDTRGGTDWEVFTEALLRYQYVKTEIAPEEAKPLLDRLHWESQGIPDIAVKLFALAQRRAITVGEPTGEERLTPDLITAVAREELALVRPIIEALRQPLVRAEELAALDDVVLPSLAELLDIDAPAIRAPEVPPESHRERGTPRSRAAAAAVLAAAGRSSAASPDDGGPHPAADGGRPGTTLNREKRRKRGGCAKNAAEDAARGGAAVDVPTLQDDAPATLWNSVRTARGAGQTAHATLAAQAVVRPLVDARGEVCIYNAAAGGHASNDPSDDARRVAA